MAQDWAGKFTEKLTRKAELARSRSALDFDTYRGQVHALFEFVEQKVSPVAAIRVQRLTTAQTTEFRQGLSGPIETIMILDLHCGDRHLQFIPQGTNFDNCLGRIRVKHDSRALPIYLYLCLVKRPVKGQDQLVWVVHRAEDQGPPTGAPLLDESSLEQVVENAFL